MDPLSDVRYEVEDGLCWITIDRPQRHNSFTAHTVDELITCFKRAWADAAVGVVALTGAGEKAFCTGGDQKQRAQSGDYGPSRSGLFEIETLHRTIRDIPKPVIAAVNGLAIGGGHVLHVICDLSIAAEHARFGQAGPRVGSFDAGFGTGYLARVVGAAELRAEVRRYADEMLALSPTALRFLKQSFNQESEHLAGQAALAFSGLHEFASSEEAAEGLQAFDQKRAPDFARFRAHASRPI